MVSPNRVINTRTQVRQFDTRNSLETKHKTNINHCGITIMHIFKPHACHDIKIRYFETWLVYPKQTQIQQIEYLFHAVRIKIERDLDLIMQSENFYKL